MPEDDCTLKYLIFLLKNYCEKDVPIFMTIHNDEKKIVTDRFELKSVMAPLKYFTFEFFFNANNCLLIEICKSLSR